MRVSGLGNWKKDEFGVENMDCLAIFQKKLKNGMNEVGFRFHELSLGQHVPLDCGNSLGQFLANNSRKTGEKSRFFPCAGVENPGRGSKIPIQTAGPHMGFLPDS